MVSTIFLIAACAVTVVVVQAAYRGSDAARLACVFLLPPCIYGAVSVPLYLTLYGVGRFDRYVDARTSGPESPFAEERLPSQIIAPVTPEEAR